MALFTLPHLQDFRIARKAACIGAQSASAERFGLLGYTESFADRQRQIGEQISHLLEQSKMSQLYLDYMSILAKDGETAPLMAQVSKQPKAVFQYGKLLSSGHHEKIMRFALI